MIWLFIIIPTNHKTHSKFVPLRFAKPKVSISHYQKHTQNGSLKSAHNSKLKLDTQNINQTRITFKYHNASKCSKRQNTTNWEVIGCVHETNITKHGCDQYRKQNTRNRHWDISHTHTHKPYTNTQKKPWISFVRQTD